MLKFRFDLHTILVNYLDIYILICVIVLIR